MGTVSNDGVDLGEPLRNDTFAGIDPSLVTIFEFPVAALPLLPLTGDSGTVEVADDASLDPRLKMMPFTTYPESDYPPTGPEPTSRTSYSRNIGGIAPSFVYAYPGMPLGLVLSVLKQ